MDHLGSVRSVVRARDGRARAAHGLRAFGVVLDDWSASGWMRIPFGFAGGLYDRETGLVRFGAREYDARVGRWVSRDPALFGGGDSNLYRYCGGEPVNFIDPNGRFWLPALIGVVVVARVGYGIWQAYRLGQMKVTAMGAMSLNPTRYPGHDHDQDDKFWHCTGFCVMSQSVPIAGAFAAQALSVAHDWDETDDRRANRLGEQLGCQSSGGTSVCAGLCAQHVGTENNRRYLTDNPVIPITPGVSWNQSRPSEDVLGVRRGQHNTFGQLFTSGW
ncbi:MAG: RHS repeat-associated core domain-containing protein [Polyangiales bacterium]